MYIRKRKQRCTSRCCLAEAGERKNRNQDSPPKEVGVFSFHRELRPMKQKTLREDAHSREAETCRKRPRSARECAKAHSFLLPKIRGVKITCVILGNPVKYGQKIT